MTRETIDITPLMTKIEKLSKSKDDVLEILELHRKVLEAHFNNTGERNKDIEDKISELEERYLDYIDATQ